MGVRYRKSIKICKGVRVNVSKTGVSLTLGGRGASVNIGGRGAYVNTGIPGTGISSRERIASPAPQPEPERAAANPMEILVQMDDRGRVELMYGDGRPVTDAAIIRKIKATPAFAAEKSRLETMRREKIKEILRTQQEDAAQLIHIERLAPKVLSEKKFWAELEKMHPEYPTLPEFQTPKPDAASLRESLVKEAAAKIKPAAFWRRKRLRSAYVEQNLPQRYQTVLEQWQRQKQLFDDESLFRWREEKSKLDAQCQQRKQELTACGNGEPDAVCREIDAWLQEMELPVTLSVDYEYDADAGKLLLDVDLPEIEELPTTHYVRLSSGNLSEKNKTQTALRDEYATLIFGISVFLAANFFNMSPEIQQIILSGYSQRRNSVGSIANEYLLSVRFTRPPFEAKCAGDSDPIAFCQQFENRCKMSQTKVFKPIEPFEE